MRKKCNKILLALIFMFLCLITTVSAKEITLEELAKEVKVIEPDTTYVYIIGEYAFTSEFGNLTTQDVMLASRTIEVSENSGKTNSDAIYNEMAIVNLESTYDDNWEINGFEYSGNIVGTASQKEKYDVKYIDYKKISEESLEISGVVDNACNVIVNQTGSNNKFAVSKTGNAVSVTIKETGMTSVEALAGTGIGKAAQEILETEGIKSVTILIPGGTSVEVTSQDIMSKLEELDNLFIELTGKTDPAQATAGDLAGKSIIAIINLEDGYTTKDATNFTVSFFKEKEITVQDKIDDACDIIVNQTGTNDKFAV
jgi:hypothetical protein